MGAVSESKSPDKKAGVISPIDEPLIPIHLELEVDGQHLNETFTWNLNEPRMTPEAFARVLCGDLGLSNEAANSITESMRDQIESYSNLPPFNTTTTTTTNSDGNSNRNASNGKKQGKRICRVDKGESRQIVKLELRVGRVILQDQFEWDLNNSENSPEMFAEVLCSDLGVGLEFVPVVAHGIRQELIELAAIRDRKRAPEPLNEKSVIRAKDAQYWEPVINCLSFDEQEQIERKESREARLARRNRGRVREGPKGVSKQRKRQRSSRPSR